MNIKSVPLAKNSVHVELRLLLLNGGHEIEVGVRAAGKSYIYSGDDMCVSISTPAKIIANVCRQHIAENLPFGHPAVTDLAELRKIMDGYTGESLPVRDLVAAGWGIPA